MYVCFIWVIISMGMIGSGLHTRKREREYPLICSIITSTCARNISSKKEGRGCYRERLHRTRTRMEVDK